MLYVIVFLETTIKYFPKYKQYEYSHVSMYCVPVALELFARNDLQQTFTYIYSINTPNSIHSTYMHDYKFWSILF